MTGGAYVQYSHLSFIGGGKGGKWLLHFKLIEMSKVKMLRAWRAHSFIHVGISVHFSNSVSMNLSV